MNKNDFKLELPKPKSKIATQISQMKFLEIDLVLSTKYFTVVVDEDIKSGNSNLFTTFIANGKLMKIPYLKLHLQNNKKQNYLTYKFYDVSILDISLPKINHTNNLTFEISFDYSICTIFSKFNGKNKKIFIQEPPQINGLNLN